MISKGLVTGILLICVVSGQQFQPQQPFQNQPNMNTNFQQRPGQNIQVISGINQNFQTVPGMNLNLPSGPEINQNVQPGMPNADVIRNQNTNDNSIIEVTDVSQTSNEDQSQVVCAQAGRMTVSQCFQQNGGFQMVTVIALLSNGSQGQLPQNAEQVKQNLCQVHGQIIACVFNSIRVLNGTHQCSTAASFGRLEQETVGLLSGVQQLCGKGLLPKISPCMGRLSYDLTQCYTEVGLNFELYSPLGSRLEGALIGDNREVAKLFCSKRREFYSCQKRVVDQCEGAKTFQELSGSDVDSQHAGMDVLCKDIDVYVSGLVCFQSPSKDVEACANDLQIQMTEMTINQLANNLSVEVLFRDYCKVRITNLRCDSNAWGKICEASAVELKTEYQCNVLPHQCKNNPITLERYNEVCSEKSFTRHLKNPESSAISILKPSSLFMTTFLITLCTVL